MKQNTSHEHVKHEAWGIAAAYAAGMLVTLALLIAPTMNTKPDSLKANTTEAAGFVDYIGPKIPEYCVDLEKLDKTSAQYKYCAQYYPVLTPPASTDYKNPGPPRYVPENLSPL